MNVMDRLQAALDRCDEDMPWSVAERVMACIPDVQDYVRELEMERDSLENELLAHTPADWSPPGFTD